MCADLQVKMHLLLLLALMLLLISPEYLIQKAGMYPNEVPPHLRKTLFQIVMVLLRKSDPHNPVYLFMDKKRAEGKHFYVYMVAGAAKFLRIYYAKVKSCFDALETV